MVIRFLGIGGSFEMIVVVAESSGSEVRGSEWEGGR